MYWAERYLGSNNLQHQTRHKPSVSYDLGIYSWMMVIDLVLFQHFRKLCQVFVLESRTALARCSENIVLFIVCRQKQGAIGSSPSSPPSESSYDDQVDGVLHL